MQNLDAAALEHAGDAIIVIDPQGIILRWNAKATELFGWTADHAIGSSVHLLIPERLREMNDTACTAAIERGSLASDGRARRTKALTADGGKVYVEMTFALLIDDETGHASGAIAVARPSAEA